METEETKEDTNKPIRQVRTKNWSISVFNGKFGEQYCLQKGFKRTPESAWEHQSVYFYESDIAVLMDLIGKLKIAE